MSRFRPPLVQRNPLPAPSPIVTVVQEPLLKPPSPKAPAPIVRLAPQTANIVQKVGFFFLLVYLTSPMIGEWAAKLMGVKTHLPIVSGLLLPVCWLASGATLRGLRNQIGWWLSAFAFWIILASPFSIYKHGSLDLLMTYIPRSYLMYFFVTALVVSMGQFRFLIYTQVLLAAALLATCFAFGQYSEDGRFNVPGGFFGNSNELAMQLLMGVPFFVFLFVDRGIVWKVLALAGIVLSALIILRTGSRGGLVGAVAYGVFYWIFSNKKVAILVVGVLSLAIGALMTPTAAMNRILQIGIADERVPIASSAMASTTSRIELLRLSLVETITHPFFGVGPGQFVVKIAGEREARGEWGVWLGTHNSYTEVSSECGIPALIFYCGVIVLSMRANFRIFKATRARPANADLAALSLALLSCLIVYAVCTFFFHMSYTVTLPTFAGMTVALHLLAKPALLNPVINE
jgi:O-antigen ligase